MPYFRTVGGSILEIDIPDDGTMARERHDEQVANGDLFEVSDVVRVDLPTGGYVWELAATVGSPSEPTPDPTPVETATVDAGEVPSGTIDDVLEWVGNDAGRASTAMDAEMSGKARSSLIRDLARIAEAD